MTEQELLEELERSIESNNRNNLDLIKVLNGTDTQDVTLQDGSVVPSLSKRVQAEVVEDSNYLFKSDNLAGVENKQTARTNLGVPSVTEMNTAITNATPNATETTAGKAKIATTAIAQAGVNDTDIITTKKLRDALNATGNAPVSACRAWVLYDCTVTPLVIRASFNIASVTYLGGNAESLITFIDEMPSANFVAIGSCGGGVNAVDGTAVNTNYNAPPTTKTCRVGLKDAGGGGGNRSYVSVAFFA